MYHARDPVPGVLQSGFVHAVPGYMISTWTNLFISAHRSGVYESAMLTGPGSVPWLSMTALALGSAALLAAAAYRKQRRWRRVLQRRGAAEAPPPPRPATPVFVR
eukprot:tig00000492_g1400.t1